MPDNMERFEDKIDKILTAVTNLRIEQARHDERAATLANQLTEHTAQDAHNFTEIKQTLDELKLKHAVEEKMHKKNSAKIAGGVSLLLTAIAYAIMNFFHVDPQDIRVPVDVTVEQPVDAG